MEDIAPALMEDVKESFERLYNEDEQIAALLEKLRSGTVKYEDAYNYAIRISALTEIAYKANVSAEGLPDRTMYYNIAQRLLTETMKTDHDLIAKYAETVQTELNAAANIGVKAQTVPCDGERVSHIINVATSGEYDVVEATVIAYMENYSLHIVDESIKRNAEFLSRSGLRQTIVRKAASGCCDWCKKAAGVYDYMDMADDTVFRRHKNCKCICEYDPGDGRNMRQDVWTKEWHSY